MIAAISSKKDQGKTFHNSVAFLESIIAQKRRCVNPYHAERNIIAFCLAAFVASLFAR
jgi:hypothetical protein